MRHKNFISNQAGFSLIEVAIVLAIIGIIIAGVLKGQDLLENARLKSIYNQINEFRIATHTFYDRFGSLPGDYGQAKETINPNLSNGNNDGILQADECQSFWTHLKSLQLITVEKDYPTSRLGGNFIVVCNQENLPGIWFCLGSQDGNNMKALLTPLQAMTLMSHYDNIDPNSGRIQARDGSDAAGRCIQDNKLNLNNKMPACILYFQL